MASTSWIVLIYLFCLNTEGSSEELYTKPVFSNERGGYFKLSCVEGRVLAPWTSIFNLTTDKNYQTAMMKNTGLKSAVMRKNLFSGCSDRPCWENIFICIKEEFMHRECSREEFQSQRCGYLMSCGDTDCQSFLCPMDALWASRTIVYIYIYHIGSGLDHDGLYISAPLSKIKLAASQKYNLTSGSQLYVESPQFLLSYEVFGPSERPPALHSWNPEDCWSRGSPFVTQTTPQPTSAAWPSTAPTVNGNPGIATESPGINTGVRGKIAKLKVAAIGGGIAGALILLVILVVIIIQVKRRSRANTPSTRDTTHSNVQATPVKGIAEFQEVTPSAPNLYDAAIPVQPPSYEQAIGQR